MKIHSITGTENEASKTVCLTVADEESGGKERFFLSRKLFYKIYGHFTAQMPITEADYDEIKDAADKTAAIREASRLIGNGEKSKRELCRRLKMRNISSDAAEFALALLEKNGYLDEESSAARIARSAVASKHYGPRRVTEYLLAHGYNSTTVKEVVSSLSPEDTREALFWQIEHKLPAIANSDSKERQKAMATLMRLGFSADEIRDGIKEYRNTYKD